MHWFLFIALWAGLGFAMANIVPLDYFYFIWVPMGIAFLIWGINIEKRKMKHEVDEENKITETKNKEKESLFEKYGLPIDCPTYKYLSGYKNIENKDIIYVWIRDNVMNLLIGEKNMQKYQMPLSDINFYSVKGDVRQETENIGGNATVGETVVAEGMFGTAAAMKRNQVVQNIKTIDERKTIINANVEGGSSFIFFEGAELYNYLLENIPEKEQSFVAMAK